MEPYVKCCLELDESFGTQHFPEISWLTIFFLKKLKNTFVLIKILQSWSHQIIDATYIHYIYRRTYHEKIISLVQKTADPYCPPLRPLK